MFFFFLSYLGEAHSLVVEKVLFKEKSEYQEVLVFEVWSCFLLFAWPSHTL